MEFTSKKDVKYFYVFNAIYYANPLNKIIINDENVRKMLKT